MEMQARHQNLMLALRFEMGWPLERPANDCIAFSSGREMDIGTGMELARIAQLLRKDVIYSGCASTKAVEPTTFCVAYRELLTVDIVDRVVPYAAGQDVPVQLISTRADEVFVVDQRGSLVRLQGKPKDLGKGRRLAMKRIKATAAARSDDLLKNNRFVAPGADWIEPEADITTIVRFD